MFKNALLLHIPKYIKVIIYIICGAQVNSTNENAYINERAIAKDNM